MSDNLRGFQGAVAGLSLTDVIQLKGHSRYSGCITVTYGDQSGSIFFADGEIIHGEQAGETGEKAILRILHWPGGTFSIHPEMTTNVCTIHRRTDHLLLDMLRRLDEERAGMGAAEQGEQMVTPRRTMSKLAARLLELPSVTYAVLLDKQGTPLQDSSIEAAALAHKGVFLAGNGDRLGALFGLGAIKAAAVQTRNFGLLLYDSRQHYLTVAVNPGIALETAENEIKAILVPAR